MINTKSISFEQITIDKGFWGDKQKMIGDVTLPHVYGQFDKTGRFDAIYPWWKKPFIKSHIFYDSDTAKWIEAAAYVLTKRRAEYPELEALCDDLIERFAVLQKRNGYVNSYFQRTLHKKYFHRTWHELYCLGHLAEAAIAYKNATGKDKLMHVVDKNLDYVKTRFMDKKNADFTTPGHEEIELALFRMYEATGNAKYKEMAEFFINERGVREEPTYDERNSRYDQSNKPARELASAEGHSVRALYLYCAMADMAKLNGDKRLYDACKRLYDDIKTKTYITGGIGSTYDGESFTVPYDLPNLTAYCESCAAISLLMFSRRMSLLDMDAEYADTVERVMYNNLLSGISMDGKAFFYENPLEIRRREFTKNGATKKSPRLPIIQRKVVFETSCCPANIARFIAAIGDNVFTEDEACLYVHQYIDCTLATNGGLKVATDYPYDGKINISSKGFDKSKIALRIPGWCKSYKLEKNGVEVSETPIKGYVTLEVESEFSIALTLDIKPVFMYCNPLSYDNRNSVALMAGACVYCAEEVDNGSLAAIALDPTKEVSPIKDKDNKVCGYEAEAYRMLSDKVFSDEPPKGEPIKLKFIPYREFANRGESDMRVWIPIAIN